MLHSETLDVVDGYSISSLPFQDIPLRIRVRMRDVGSMDNIELRLREMLYESNDVGCANIIGMAGARACS